MYNFPGRGTRRQYLAVNSVAILVLTAVFSIGYFAQRLGSFDWSAIGLMTMGIVYAYVVMIGESTRRLRDLGKTPKLAALTAIPAVGMLFMVTLSVAPGENGPNQYGEDPR